MEEFFEIFGDLVLKLQETNKHANINLLDFSSPESQNYLNLLFAAGYVQGILKATRLQNLKKSLIGHIHFNKSAKKVLFWCINQ
jgi:hypothetical protein